MTIAYTLALAIGNLIDPPATMVNASGDYVATFIVSRFIHGKNWMEKSMEELKEEIA
jgi:Na+/H+-dicarboxylate symporter